MAGYREHVTVSGLCGIGYAVASTTMLGFTPVQGTLAGVLTGVGGMLPDIDSESGRPVREIFGLVAAIAPVLLLRRCLEWGGHTEAAMLFSIGLYFTIKYGGQFLLGKLSVHRGMFHSIPALIISAELVFLAYQSESLGVRFLMAGGVAIGFFSHLLLDEMYAVQWSGVRLKLNKAAGSAIKMFSKNVGPNVFAYSLLFVLTYATLVTMGLVSEPEFPANPPLHRQAADELPMRH